MSAAGLDAIFAVFAVGMLVWFAGGVWMVVRAFQVHPLWAVACLLFPPANLAFLVLHFGQARGPFATQLVGVALAALTVQAFDGHIEGLLSTDRVAFQRSRTLDARDRKDLAAYYEGRGIPADVRDGAVWVRASDVERAVEAFVAWQRSEPDAPARPAYDAASSLSESSVSPLSEAASDAFAFGE